MKDNTKCPKCGAAWTAIKKDNFPVPLAFCSQCRTEGPPWPDTLDSTPSERWKDRLVKTQLPHGSGGAFGTELSADIMAALDRITLLEHLLAELLSACREALLWTDQDSRGGEECIKMLVAAIAKAEANNCGDALDWKRFSMELLSSNDLILEQLRSAVAVVQKECERIIREYRAIKERDDGDCISKALAVAAQYAGIDGGHHKQWVIDQIVRELTGAGYESWVEAWEHNEDEPDEPYKWDKGIAP